MGWTVELLGTKPKQDDDDDGATRPPEDSANECLSRNTRLPLFCISIQRSRYREADKKKEKRMKNGEFADWNAFAGEDGISAGTFCSRGPWLFHFGG